MTYDGVAIFESSAPPAEPGCQRDLDSKVNFGDRSGMWILY